LFKICLIKFVRFHLFLKDRNIFKAVLSFFEKNYQSSKDMLEKALEYDRKNFITYFYLGEIEEHFSNIRTAVQYFQKAQR